MAKETLDVVNKLIISTGGQDDKSQEIFESLESISNEELMQVGEEFENTQKDEKKFENYGGDLSFEMLGEVDDSNLEFERNKRIIKRKGKFFDLNTQTGEKDFMAEAFGVMKSSDITKVIPILGAIFGDSTMTKLHEYLTGCGFDSL